MVAPSAGTEGRGTGDRHQSQRQHDRADIKKNILKPHLKQQWVIPPTANAAFVAAMEDVLAVYTRPRDPDRPLVCLDETSKQLIRETRMPVPMKCGRPRRVDYEYERNGTANIFMLFAPLEGWRHVEVTDRHAAADYAAILRDLSDRYFSKGEQDRFGSGQSQHAYRGLALCLLRAGRGAPPRGAVRVALHAEARQLVGHGGIGARGPVHCSVWVDASRTSIVSSAKSPPGSSTETNTTPRRTGSSQTRKRGSNSSGFTRHFH